MTRGRRVRTSVLRRIQWHGYTEYRGTLTTLVPDLRAQRGVLREFDAFFSLSESFLGYTWCDLRVMNERPV